MSQSPRVSIVIPTYNSAAYLAAAVESVRAQTFADWEIVVSDDGSTDTSVALAEELARSDERIRVVRGAHCGVAPTRNRGFQHTSPQSQFVTFLDSDDVWEPGALELLVDALETHPECPAAHGLARAVDTDGEPIDGDDLSDTMRHRRAILDRRCIVDLPISAPTTFEAELVLNYLVTPGTSLIRRDVFAALGGFEGAATPAEDWDMNLRLARLGGIALVDEVVLRWRRHPTSLSNTSKRNRRARLVVWQRAIESAENTPAQRRAAWSALYGDLRSVRAGLVEALAHRRIRAAAKALALIALYYRLIARLYLTSRVRGANPARPLAGSPTLPGIKRA